MFGLGTIGRRLKSVGRQWLSVAVSTQPPTRTSRASATCGAATPPRWDEAEAHLATSLRTLESGEARLPAAHAQLLWGQLCRDRQDTAAALDHAQRAADQFAASQLDDEMNQARKLIDDLTTV
jgi:hypothetical protein